jgi:hypothetical protein
MPSTYVLPENLDDVHIVLGGMSLDRSELPGEAVTVNPPAAGDSEIGESLCDE